MSGIYSASLVGAQSAITTPVVDLVTPATTSCRLTEFFLQNSAAGIAANNWGLGLSPSPSGQLGPMPLLPEDPNNPIPCLSTLAATWSMAPTVPVIFLRRIAITNAVGLSILITWPRGLGVPAGRSLVLWNVVSSPAAPNTHWVINE